LLWRDEKCAGNTWCWPVNCLAYMAHAYIAPTTKIICHVSNMCVIHNSSRIHNPLNIYKYNLGNEISCLIAKLFCFINLTHSQIICMVLLISVVSNIFYTYRLNTIQSYLSLGRTPGSSGVNPDKNSGSFM
jgi:hypothetical protein